MVGNPHPLQMTFFRAHLVRRRRDGVYEDVQETECDVGGGERETIRGEQGTAESLNGGEGLDPEKEGSGPTGEGVDERMSWVGEGPGDGFDGLHDGDGRTEKEESGIQLAVNADEDSEGTECERLEADGGVPAHLVGSGRFVFHPLHFFLMIYITVLDKMPSTVPYNKPCFTPR